MDNQLHSLSKIFTERILRIPDYQRGYAWEERQLRDFWNDILQLEEEKNHYTGVLTLEEVPQNAIQRWEEDLWIIKSKSFQPYYVVDGQQRLTTSIILVQVILEETDAVKKLNYTSHEEIQKKFIFDSKDEGISRSYIFGYEKDNPSYEYLKTKIFVEHSSTGADLKETIYTHNLEQAKLFFKQRLKGMKHDQIELVYRKLTQHLLFNMFTIAEEVDVCVAFETMNNRGKPLSYLELLKNRLIFLSLKFTGEPDYERDHLRNSINDCWKSIYHNLGKNKKNPLEDDRFLFTHFVVYFGKEAYGEEEHLGSTRFRRLDRADYATFLLERKFIHKNVSSEASQKERITLKDLYDYVSSLQVSVELWYKIFNPFDSDFSNDTKIWLDKLNRIGIGPIAALIMVFFQEESSEGKRVSILKALERYLFLMRLVSYRYGYHLDYSAEIWQQHAIDLRRGKSNPDKTLKAINDACHSIIERQDFMNEVKTFIRSKGFYGWPGIKYLLFEYNLSLQTKTRTSRPKIFWSEFTEDKSDYISVEHIYPQRPRHEYWQKGFDAYTQKQKTLLRHSLGNLLPLSSQKNSSLQNKPFPEKIEGTANEFVGYRYGCYAENEVAKYKEWNAKAILERGIKLLQFVEKRWELSFGSKEDLVHLLGLEFITTEENTNAASTTKAPTSRRLPANS